MNSMTRDQKIGYIVVRILGALLVGVGIGMWGGGVFPFYIALAFGVRLEVELRNKVTKLYWRKQVWRCDTCNDVIEDGAEAIITFHMGGRTKRYDKVECMSAGISGGLA